MRNTKKNTTPATPGFACEIKEDTGLGYAMLIAVFGDNTHQPIGIAGNIGEAREIADCDLKRRRRLNAIGGQGTAPIPTGYRVWARGRGGEYKVAATLPA